MQENDGDGAGSGRAADAAAVAGLAGTRLGRCVPVIRSVVSIPAGIARMPLPRFLMLTAIGPNLNEMTAPLYGADDHLDKPFLIDELLERLEALATRYHKPVASHGVA